MNKLGSMMFTVVAALFLASSPTHLVAQDTHDSSTKIDVSFRYRYETVEQKGGLEKAKGSTLRTRATIKTDWGKGFETVIEFDDVSIVGQDDYNAGQGNTPDKTTFAVIADPKGTEVNQALVRYRTDSSDLSFGKQRILIGNQRFVGGVGWRQNEQTFDSVTYNHVFEDKLTFNYAYIGNVNRIFGEQVSAGDHKHNTHLINVDYPIASGQLFAYYFSIDNENIATLSNDTLGLRFVGKTADFGYTIEWANQTEAADNPNNYRADYYLLEASYQQPSYSVSAGLEVLGGDAPDNQAFTTSLATLHKFQGWADVFLTTPAGGIEDVYIKGSYRFNGYHLIAVYHDFKSDVNNVNFGTEIDLSVSKKINDKFGVLLKYADFSSDNTSFASREKLWLMLSYQI